MPSKALLIAGTLALSASAFSLCAAAGSGAQAASPGPQSTAAKAGTLRAAAAKVDITPQTPQWLSGYGPRQSTGVLDPIFHRVVALEAAGTSFYLVASDLCLFSPTLYDNVTRDLQKELGIDPKQVLWSVTHSHATPEIGPPEMYKTLLGRSDHDWDRENTARTTRALIDAVRTARDRLEPAQIAFGSGIALANINRRARDVDGRISIGLNPEGPVDRRFNLIRLTRPDGTLIALVANYAMHGTVMNGENVSISGDGPGTVTAYLEEKLGATVLYVNGAAGNIAPIYSVYPNARAGHLSQFRVLLGDRILAAFKAMGPGTADVNIRHGEKIVDTPRKDGLNWPPELAAYGREGPRPLVRLPIRFVRINDTAIWSAPVETLLRDRDARGRPVALRSHDVLRVHQRVARIPAHGERLRRGRVRTAHVTVHGAG